MDTNRLATIRHLALDMDGTIYRGGTLFDFTLDFLALVESLGIGYTFLTNNSSKSVQHYVEHLQRFGIHATRDRLFTSTLSTFDYLREALPNVRRLYVLGTPSLQDEFREAGFTVVSGEEEPEAVIAGFDTTLTFPRLCKAAWWVQQGKPFVATHPDFICPTDLPTVLVDCGAVCACIESATGRKPDAVLGKPDRRMLTGILRRHGLAPNELAMIGDRIYTDMAMARRAGAFAVLVLTGEATQADADACATPPDLVVPNLKDFGDRLAAAKRGTAL
jgi:NagD protein